jgi:serine/threonine protein kinase
MSYPESGRSNDGDLVVLGISELREIGRGATATVYAARQERYARDVAVKIFFAPLLDEKARRRFERECRTLGRLSTHPNVVNLLGSGFDEDGRPFLVMDLCRGGSLLQILASSGPMSVEDVLRIGVKVGSALAYAHMNDVLHRDIKPGNILLTEFGEPVLGDFGISDEAQHEMSWTIGASLTPLYAAPEVLEHGGGSSASDVWSLAATLYALLLGDAPFADTGASLVALINKITHDAPRTLSRTDVPPHLRELLAGGMAKDPADRVAGAAALARGLQTLQRDNGMPVTEFVEVRQQQAPPVAAPAPPTVNKPWDAGMTRSPIRTPQGDPTLISSVLPRTHRARWPYFAAAAVIVLGAGGTALALADHSSHPTTTGDDLVALSAPSVKVDCTGYQCSVTGSAPAAGSTVQVDFGDGKTHSFDGQTIEHSYAKAGSYVVSAKSVDGGRTSSTVTNPVSLHSWSRSATLSGSSPTSDRLTLRLASSSADCVAGKFQLQAEKSGRWSDVGSARNAGRHGTTHLTVGGPGRYRVQISGSSIKDGVCGATTATTTVHAAASTTPNYPVTNPDPTPTYKVPVKPTFAPQS